MSRTFAFPLSYTSPASVVHGAITDQRLWQSRIEGVDSAELDFGTPDGPGTASISMKETIKQERIPALVRKVLKGELTISRTDKWGAFDGDRATGTFSGGSTGLPASLNGTFALRDTAAGAVIDVAGEIEVKVRFVGGAIEALVEQLFTKMLNSERKYVEKWITEQAA
ncbi:DUF2505 domain-containing protein [Antrihabitans cavernicola]|uniref:DUF2505 domain-containing protein n=1 Tax=Antrihabitans cavernicola TaxID=2495913 RepID=A0A5A7S8H8_9NOCA|nr:DUF2505 domain-containing protein [Spelaeibacter cavernicola]KAA0020184.1 DUF2505 domain-containing protein [Spelaeibacter cavernicola]